MADEKKFLVERPTGPKKGWTPETPKKPQKTPKMGFLGVLGGSQGGVQKTPKKGYFSQSGAIFSAKGGYCRFYLGGGSAKKSEYT
jgi:hypothetical protein